MAGALPEVYAHAARKQADYAIKQIKQVAYAKRKRYQRLRTMFGSIPEAINSICLLGAKQVGRYYSAMPVIKTRI